MQIWKCMVIMPSNHINTIEVEAYTYSDAISIAESSTGGKCTNATAQYRSYTNSDTESSNESISGGGILFVLLIAFVIAAWKYVLLIGGIALLMWWLWKNWD